jgi:hypothetical protein
VAALAASTTHIDSTPHVMPSRPSPSGARRSSAKPPSSHSAPADIGTFLISFIPVIPEPARGRLPTQADYRAIRVEFASIQCPRRVRARRTKRCSSRDCGRR